LKKFMKMQEQAGFGSKVGVGVEVGEEEEVGVGHPTDAHLENTTG
jgi:hypothetical protein